MFFITSKEENDLDDIDFEILKFLQEDASISFTEIARKLKISESTVRKRIEKLKQKGIIKKFTIIVNPLKMGFNAISIIGIDVEPSRILEVVKKLCEIPEIKNVSISTGDHMIIIEIWAKNTNELLKIIEEKIGVINGIERICPSIILEKIKE
ncbi:MAG: Lrp/AsnC family transcriptional regulator [Candidatus Methanomethylicaceae archaeon]|nr:Lrp/AsnC family transcriptional regulator [Candidatus Verstraetearchaeota archaeon]